MKIFLSISLSILLMTQITGCMNAAMSGAQAVYDQRKIKRSLHDSYVSMRSERAVYVDTGKYQKTNVSFATFNDVVLITGQVNTPEQKQEIEDIVRKFAGTSKIYNMVEISNSSSHLTRMSDSWITAKVKSKFIAHGDIDPSQIKVVTENGTVYLMGVIPPDQAAAAVEIARTTEGVQNVVKVFSYLRISPS